MNAQINGMKIAQGTKWIARNPLTGKREEIDPNLDEFLPGQTALKVYWSNTCAAYVTLPDSLKIMTRDGWVTDWS